MTTPYRPHRDWAREDNATAGLRDALTAYRAAFEAERAYVARPDLDPVEDDRLLHAERVAAARLAGTVTHYLTVLSALNASAA